MLNYIELQTQPLQMSKINPVSLKLNVKDKYVNQKILKDF